MLGTNVLGHIVRSQKDLSTATKASRTSQFTQACRAWSDSRRDLLIDVFLNWRRGDWYQVRGGGASIVFVYLTTAKAVPVPVHEVKIGLYLCLVIFGSYLLIMTCIKLLSVPEPSSNGIATKHSPFQGIYSP